MNVSVIVPAYNAAATVGKTLDSLLAQTYERWDAIVVDDGSTDETAAVVDDFARRDARIRLVRQDNQGGSAARNTGIALAGGEWFLFLDADDWILPRHLERMVARLQADPALDAVHCGWARVSPQGDLGADQYAPDVADMFDLFAQTCPFQPHACVVRASLVRAVGGFEGSLRSCQDWDLWQKVARTGARFGAVCESLSRYRTRPGSISLDGFRLIEDGLQVITRGHSVDDRVPEAAHPTGRAVSHLAGASLLFAVWPAGLVLGAGHDARPLLQNLVDDVDPHLSPSRVAAYLFEAALLSKGRSEQEWVQLWPQIASNLVAFLQALEQSSGAAGLAQRAQRELEATIAAVLEKRPVSVGQTRALDLDVDAMLPHDLSFKGISQLHCRLFLAGENLGAISLPAPGGSASRASLVDAISQEYGWSILGRFFEQTIYPQLRFEEDAEGLSLWRGELCLAQNLPDAEELSWSTLHDDIGWTLFLQEVWGKPDWPRERFYEPEFEEAPHPSFHASQATLNIEVSDPLADVTTEYQELEIRLLVGGAPLGGVTMTITDNTITAQQIRVALTEMAGFELCRLAVRQGLVGRPLTDPPSLRRRLQEAAASAGQSDAPNHGT